MEYEKTLNIIEYVYAVIFVGVFFIIRFDIFLGWYPCIAANTHPYGAYRSRIVPQQKPTPTISSFSCYPFDFRHFLFVLPFVFLLLVILLFNICSTKILKNFFDLFARAKVPNTACKLPKYIQRSILSTTGKNEKLFLSRRAWQIIGTITMLFFSPYSSISFSLSLYVS